jgi:hypothetical protein
MARSRKRKSGKRDRYASFADFSDEAEEDADLPKDEAGRRKIKRQYLDLLGIRIEKLRGRILNRERINKTIEGIYFICSQCMKVCHSLDDGLVEDPTNQHNICGACSKPEPAVRRASRSKAGARPARSKRTARRAKVGAR